MMSRSRFSILVLAALLLAVSGAEAASVLNEAEFQTIWRNNGAVEGIQEFFYGQIDWTERTALVQGRAPLPGDAAPSRKLLSRRAAVTDLYRRTLGLLYEVKYGLPRRVQSISLEGWVHPGKFVSEGAVDGQYVVEAVMPLKQLLEDCVVFGK